MSGMTRQQLLDLYFLEARARMVDVAAFLDRLDRAEGEADFRLEAFKHALNELQREGEGRTERVLRCLSDPTLDPLPAATSKAAIGAWPGPA